MLKYQAIKPFLALLVICLIADSCMFKGFSQPYETTIQLVDMDGKPIKNVKVNIKMFISYSGGSFNTNQGDFRTSSTTNLEGNTVFNYSLSISDSNTDGASFAAADDTLWKVVTDVYHTVSNTSQKRTIKQVLKIQMDTLKTIKVRLQKASSKAGQLTMFAKVNNGNSDPNKNISNATYTHSHTTRLYENKSVFDWRTRVLGAFDSTVTAKIFSKSFCYLYADSSVDAINSNGTPYFDRVAYKTIEFSNTTNRDAIVYFISKF